MNTPLLQVHDLATWFPVRTGILARTTGYIRAVDGISFELAPAETLGVVGESGCGKTTLGRTLAGLETQHAGEMRLRGQLLWPSSHHKRRALHRQIQMIFQDPYSSLNPRLTVRDLLTEGLVEHGLITHCGRTSAALELLHEVGMEPSALHRYPHEFSGGQRQRISIARALSLKPNLLICDEAVSALDVSVRAQVLNLLIRLRISHQLAYLFISHDLGVIRHLANRVLVMYLGVIVESGPVKAVLDSPAHPYSKALVSAIPVPFETPRQRIILAGDVPSSLAPPSGCRFRTRCPWAIPACSSQPPPMVEVAPASQHHASCIRTGDPALERLPVRT